MTHSKDKKDRVRGADNARFHIEIDSGPFGVSFLVNGVVGVCELSDVRVRLITGRGSLLLLGKRLCVSSLAGGTLEINGGIEDIQIGRGKAGGNKSDKA